MVLVFFMHNYLVVYFLNIHAQGGMESIEGFNTLKMILSNFNSQNIEILLNC